MTRLSESTKKLRRELSDSYQGIPLVIELDRGGVWVMQKGRPSTRRRIDPLGAWQSAQVRAARLPKRSMGMTPREFSTSVHG